MDKESERCYYFKIVIQEEIIQSNDVSDRFL